MEQDQHPASRPGANGFVIKNGYIEHHVSKLDTLAGVAIKYGVEVADVKRANGLVTDHQMYAHKTLRIPVGRRHPFAPAFVKSESSSLSEGALPPKKYPSLSVQPESEVEYEKRCPKEKPSSLAMNLLRGYYGLSSPAQQANGSHAGMEMTSSHKLEVEEHSDEEPFSPVTVPFTASKAGHRKPNGICNRQNAIDEAQELPVPNQTSSMEAVPPTLGLACESNSNERAVRRRFKTDTANVPSTASCLDNAGAIDVDDHDKQDVGGILDKVLPVAGLLGGPENAVGLPVALLKVFDGTLVSARGKESPVSKVKKSSSTSSLQDQTISQSNLGVQRLGPLAQGGARTLFDTPPRPLNYRYKSALD